MSEKVVDLTSKTANKNTKTTKTTRAKAKETKRLTFENIVKEVHLLSKPTTKEVKIGDDVYLYTVDTYATNTKIDKLTTELRNSVAVIVEQNVLETLSDELLEGVTAGLSCAAILKVFTDIDVPTAIIDRVQFVNHLAELNILVPILENLPESIMEAMKKSGEALEEMTRELEEITKEQQEKLEPLSKDVDELSEFVEEVDDLE